MVTKEFLDSDRVNFLVWRYLLEGNYRETAAKFQKEWHVREPHRDLEFAPHVKGHALVSVVNRGLLYNALEREQARKGVGHPADFDPRLEPVTMLTHHSEPSPPPLRPSTTPAQLPIGATTESEPEAIKNGIFGPLESPLRAKKEYDQETTAVAIEAARKRSLPNIANANGSSPKRARLTNGYENGTPPAPGDATPMDVDQSDNHAYPSPLEGEQVPQPVSRTDGPEQGTQVEKVEELTPNTTFIRLADDVAQPEATTATASASASPITTENAPILLQCEWNPKDPSALAATGTDALARVWTVSRTTNTPGHSQDHVSHAHNLISPDTPRTTTVTALAWTSDGSAIAVAADLGSQAAVNIWSAQGIHVQSMEVPEPPVVKLLWNPSNTGLLAISPEKGGAVVTVYSSLTCTSLSHHLPNQDIGATPLDATWIGDSDFLLCGGDLLVCLHCTESSIIQVRKFESKADDSFSQVLFDWRSRLAATSSDKGVLDAEDRKCSLWDESGQRRSISAHQGAITTMEWQPLPASHPVSEDERLIATGGDDCAILIWNARKPESKAKCFLTMDSPIVRLAFTPDGAFIAGATSSQVLIWKVGNTTMPRACWNRPPHPGWLSPKETDEEDEHCLCWDMTGQKLAYGSNSRLAVINFRR
ncbi:hypothetical protein G3M48_010168 [Beauveria asiatica]|uniref:Uncharacterized protein n=1 Tax=Beauveria asiatica TaxID=1069075 RepID=A0AAW0S2C3_9HYPO